MRLFQTTLVLERTTPDSNEVQVEPALWGAQSREEARGLAIAAAMDKYPRHKLTAHAVTDITDTTRAWVSVNP